jgi:glycosyltransferase involved in cell wall biosynthesis
MNVVLSYGDLSRQSGYRTRVVGELEHLDRKAGPTTLMVFDRNPAAFRNGFSTNVPFRVHSRYSIARFYHDMAQVCHRTPVKLVHAHNLYSAILALSARRVWGYKVVFDYHGRVPEEYVFLGKGSATSRKALERLERWAVRYSDHIVVVSAKLRDYLQQRYDEPQSKLSVIPCCADAGVFTWDARTREQMRRKLGVADKLVCVHLGSFFEWYEPELLVGLFQQLQSHFANAHLFVITGSAQDASAWLSSRLPSGTFTVTSTSHDQVPSLLNAADLGFLLLRRAPNIKTSSPAKFSEYLNSGLPVIITPDVGDFSEFVSQRGVGVIASGPEIDVTRVRQIVAARAKYADACVEAGRMLTWQSYGPSWTTLIQALTQT